MLGVVAILAAAVGVGLFLPLFGITLAAFVVIDLAIGFLRWRKPAVAPEEERDAEELLV